MKRAATTAAAVAIIAVGVFVVGALGPQRGSSTPPSSLTIARPAAASSLVTSARPSASTLDAQIAGLRSHIQARPQDAGAFASLGFAYVQQARVTADPSWYAKAEEALTRAPDDTLETLVATGSLELARHDFSGALRAGEQARALNPYNASVRGVTGDALLELGRYPAAFDEFQRMIDLRPDLASYARVSYARELQGDVPGAIEAMRMAANLAVTRSDEAWATFQTGELFWRAGRVDAAATAYRRATDLDPTSVPPLAGLAKVAWARGDGREAIERYRSVVSRYPAPEYVIALYDLYERAGRADLAKEQHAVLRATESLARANGVNIDLELALFDADHGDAEAAVEAARAEWARRRSVHVADALAWSLRQAGEPREAWRYAEQAMHLGTQDASILFHAGMIRLDLGDIDEGHRLLAEALRINPNFSIRYAPVAERHLGEGV